MRGSLFKFLFKCEYVGFVPVKAGVGGAQREWDEAVVVEFAANV